MEDLIKGIVEQYEILDQICDAKGEMRCEREDFESLSKEELEELSSYLCSIEKLLINF